MRVGLTFDLRDAYLARGYDLEDVAEFDYPETIDAVEAALESLGCTVTRLGSVQDLACRLVAGERWDLVFNMAEGLEGVAREAQVPALLEAWALPYTFSDPLVSALCLDKVMTKRILRDHGLPTPDHRVVCSEADAALVDLPFPLMVKPVHEGNSKGVSPASRVTDAGQLRARCAHLVGRFRQPALVEPFLPGREFTVGMLGTGPSAVAVAVMEKLLGDEPVYFKYAAGFPGRLADDPEAACAGELALRAWRALGCRDGGRVDVRSDAAGNPLLLEVNPLPGLRPGQSDLPVLCELAGIPFAELIGRIVRSALERAWTEGEPAAGTRPLPLPGRSRLSSP